MNARVARLRQTSVETEPSISMERALLVTEFYKENYGKYSNPVLRALNFKNLCEKKTIYIGEDELIVGERGPFPRAVPTFPELTCHSVEDLKVLNSRDMTGYRVSDDTMAIYENKVIPYWQHRTMRDCVFQCVPDEWKSAYEVG
ncbi:MAG: pyruvate formate lyase family protein, partial [Desulfobacterales bacterium]